MLPGKEETGKKEEAFFHFLLPVDVTLSPDMTEEAAGGFYGALASC